MKKVITVLATIALTASAYAQTDSTMRKMTPPDLENKQNQRTEIRYDGIAMQNGKMMMIKNGQMTNLDHDMTMSNGTKVMRDGSYIKKDGTILMMKEGQQMDMSGNMISKKTNNDNSTNVAPDNSNNKNE